MAELFCLHVILHYNQFLGHVAKKKHLAIYLEFIKRL